LDQPAYQDWALEDRQKAVALLATYRDPAFVHCTWVKSEPYEKDGKRYQTVGYPEYADAVDELFRLAWNSPGIDPYAGSPWQEFYASHCANPEAFRHASIGDIRRYLLLLKRQERFGDGTIDFAFRNGIVVAALERLAELTPTLG